MRKIQIVRSLQVGDFLPVVSTASLLSLPIAKYSPPKRPRLEGKFVEYVKAVDRMLKDGKSIEQVARAVDMPAQSVAKYCRVHGLKKLSERNRFEDLRGDILRDLDSGISFVSVRKKYGFGEVSLMKFLGRKSKVQILKDRIAELEAKIKLLEEGQ